MIVIERKRNLGKTTILLHYMVCNPNSIYVCYTEEYAKRAYQKAQGLGLDLSESRFKGMSDSDLKNLHSHGFKILVDDIDVITQRHPELGFNLAGIADIVTVNGGE